MPIRDLRTELPRHWTEELGGIRWLPRLIDKTRAALHGTLGDYLFGQSPMDAWLLQALGLGYRSFIEIVRQAPDDAAVLAALEARDPQGVARAREWSSTLPQRQGYYLFFLDLDEGYIAPFLKPAMNAVSWAMANSIKRLWPSRT